MIDPHTAGIWPAPTVVRMLRIGALLLERGSPELGRRIVSDAIAHCSTTLRAVEQDVRLAVFTEDPPLQTGPGSIRALLAEIELGEADGREPARLPFQPGTLAAAFAVALRRDGPPRRCPIAFWLSAWISGALPEVLGAMRAAEHGAFVGGPPENIRALLETVGLGNDITIKPANPIGSILHAQSREGRAFLQQAGANGFMAAIKVAERGLCLVIPQPAHDLRSLLQAAGLGEEDIELAWRGLVEGTILRAKTAAGRAFVERASLVGVQAAAAHAAEAEAHGEPA